MFGNNLYGDSLGRKFTLPEKPLNYVYIAELLDYIPKESFLDNGITEEELRRNRHRCYPTIVRPVKVNPFGVSTNRGLIRWQIPDLDRQTQLILDTEISDATSDYYRWVLDITKDVNALNAIKSIFGQNLNPFDLVETGVENAMNVLQNLAKELLPGFNDTKPSRKKKTKRGEVVLLEIDDISELSLRKNNSPTPEFNYRLSDLNSYLSESVDVRCTFRIEMYEKSLRRIS